MEKIDTRLIIKAVTLYLIGVLMVATGIGVALIALEIGG